MLTVLFLESAYAGILHVLGTTSLLINHFIKMDRFGLSDFVLGQEIRGFSDRRSPSLSWLIFRCNIDIDTQRIKSLQFAYV